MFEEDGKMEIEERGGVETKGGGVEDAGMEADDDREEAIAEEAEESNESEPEEEDEDEDEDEDGDDEDTGAPPWDSRRAGKEKQNIEPRSGCDSSSQTIPCMAEAKRKAMMRPRPVPP